MTTTRKDYNPTYWQYFTTFPGEEWFTLVQKILHLLIIIHPSGTENIIDTPCDQSRIDFWTLIYIWLYLPVISNVRLTLFSCLERTIPLSMKYCSQFPLSLNNLLLASWSCTVNGELIPMYSALFQHWKRDTIFTDNWIRNFITKCCLSWQTSRWGPCS